MKYWITALAVLASLSPAPALADDFKTINGKEYKNVKISRVEPDGIVLRTKSGISKVYFVELPKEVQERFHYDPLQAQAYSAQQRSIQKQRQQPDAETSNQIQFRKQLVVRCIKAKDASDVAPNLEHYEGNTLQVFGCIRQVNATVFALSGGKDNVLQDELPDAGSKSLMCYANDPSVNSKLAYCVQMYGGFNIVSFAVLEVEVVKRGSDSYPEYRAVVKSGDVLSPPALILLSQQLSLGAR